MSKLKSNIIYNFLYQFFILCFPLVLAPYLSRTIGAKGIGIYSYYYSLGYYFVAFAALGLSNYGTKTISQNSSKDNEKLSKNFCEIYTVQLITSCISITVYLLYILTLKTNTHTLIFFPYITSSLFDITWFFFGIEEFKTVLNRNIIIKLITTILIFILVKDTNDAIMYCIIMSISFLVSQISLWLKLKNKIKIKKVSAKESLKKHLPGNLKMFIPVIAVSIYKYMDKIMLGSMSSVIELGYYENVEKIVNIPVAFVTALGTIMLSRITNLYSNGDDNKSKKYLKTSIIFTGFLASAMIFGILGIANELIPIYFGIEFTPCIKICYYMVPTVFFLGLSNVIRTQYLIPVNKEKIFIISVCYGAIINLLLNLILIPLKSSEGAAIATFIAELSVFLYQLIKTRQDLKINKELYQTIGFIMIGFVMYIIIIKLNIFTNVIFNLLSKILVGAMIYIALSAIYLFIVLKNYKSHVNFKKINQGDKKHMKNIKQKIKQIDAIYMFYMSLIEKYYKITYNIACKKGKTVELISKHYYKNTGKKLSNPPKTYTEKIQFSKIFSATQEKANLTDKYLVREWIKEQIGEEYLIPLLGVWDRYEEIDFTKLPKKFVLKTNNASGTNVIIKNKENINHKKLKRKFNFWLKQNFAFSGKGYEMHYSKIKPKIICEKYIADKNNQLNDYKFLCFNGKPYYCWVDIDRMTEHKRNVYDINWNLQKWNQFNYSNSKKKLEKPKNYDKMINIATKLSKDFPHVRVDLYNVDGKIYFGEMTFTNGKGYETINPEKYDKQLGDLWEEKFKIK